MRPKRLFGLPDSVATRMPHGLPEPPRLRRPEPEAPDLWARWLQRLQGLRELKDSARGFGDSWRRRKRMTPAGILSSSRGGAEATGSLCRQGAPDRLRPLNLRGGDFLFPLPREEVGLRRLRSLPGEEEIPSRRGRGGDSLPGEGRDSPWRGESEGLAPGSGRPSPAAYLLWLSFSITTTTLSVRETQSAWEARRSEAMKSPNATATADPTARAMSVFRHSSHVTSL